MSRSRNGGFFDILHDPGNQGSMRRRNRSILDNATMAESLVRLSYLSRRPEFYDEAVRALECFAGDYKEYGYYVAGGLPSLEKLENPRPALASKVYAKDGAVLDQFAEQNRTRIALSAVPKGLIDALIATEDKDFYNHWGVNLPRFMRQMVINVLTFRQAGASTITQQLARNLYQLQGREETMYDKITRKRHASVRPILDLGRALAADACVHRQTRIRVLSACISVPSSIPKTIPAHRGAAR